MPIFNPTMIYVDPSIGTNSGTGTTGDPYGNLNYAFQQTTPDTTNGTQFNVKSTGTDIVPSGGYLCGSHSGNTSGTFIVGYTSTANDGGKCNLQSSSNDWVFENGGANLRPNNFFVKDCNYDQNGFTSAILYLGSNSRIENTTATPSNSMALGALANSEIFRSIGNSLGTGALANAGCVECLSQDTTRSDAYANNVLTQRCVSINPTVNSFRSSIYAKCCISIKTNAGSAVHFRPANAKYGTVENCIIIDNGNGTMVGCYRSSMVIRNNLYFNVGTLVADQDLSVPSQWQLENNTEMDADPFTDSANLDLRLTTAAQGKAYAPQLINIMLGLVNVPGITTDTESDLLAMLGGGGGASLPLIGNGGLVY